VPPEIRDYRPLDDARTVFDLWERALGGTYPVSERVFATRAVSNVEFEPGDGVIAVDGPRTVGFALAEIGRHAGGVRENASVAAILVDPCCQRQGIGTQLLAALEERIRAAGVTSVRAGGGFQRFWTAVPEDLPAARAFLETRGYAVVRRTPDMIIQLGSYTIEPRYRDRMPDAGVRVVNCSPDLLSALFRFQQREFPGWSPNMLALLDAGDMDNILLATHGDEVIGSITAFTPGSRFRGANLVWERIFGDRLGGYGAVGIAAAWRGRGLGAAMSQAAAVHVQSRGAEVCHIDWVGPAEFYGKLGAAVWRWFDQMTKTLG